MSREHWPLVWALVGMIILLLEGVALGRGESAYTLSYAMRLVRFDPIGRFVLWPLWVWLTVHFMLAPRWLGTRPDWRSVIAVTVGLLLAAGETWWWRR